MSIVELDAIVKDKLNYSVGAVYYLKVPGVDDLQLVETDEHLLKCLDHTLLVTRIVEVYYSHPLNAPLKQGDPEVARDCARPGSSQVPVETTESQGIEALGWIADENVGNQSDEEQLDPDFRDSDYEQSTEEDA